MTHSEPQPGQTEPDMGTSAEVYASLGAERTPEPEATATPEVRADEAIIADKLRPMITEERLRANAESYGVMKVELSPEEQLQVEAIKERLMGMPLVHATTDPQVIEAAKTAGLHGHAAGLAERGATFGIDQSLGLDEYVFANWGRLDERLGYGRHMVLIDPRAMLEHAVVTPEDIIDSRVDRDLKPLQYQDLTDEEKANIDNTYFNKMVTGRDWLEITARKVLQYAKDNPDDPYPVSELEAMGEIKIHGSVDPKYVLGDFSLPEDGYDSRRARRKWNESMLAHGIAFDYTPKTLRTKQDILSDNPGTPEHERFQAAGWREIIDKA